VTESLSAGLVSKGARFIDLRDALLLLLFSRLLSDEAVVPIENKLTRFLEQTLAQLK